MEIKIRGWNKKVKRMFYFDELWICSEYDSLALGYSGGQNEYRLHAGRSGLPSDDLSTWEFMLFSTEKDCKGKDIYGEDIVKHHRGVDVVHWETDGWRVGNWEPSYLGDFDCEVVGNICGLPAKLKLI